MMIPFDPAIKVTGPVAHRNGITIAVEGDADPLIFSAPSLDVQVSTTGSIGSRTLSTLTHSPRATVLADGPIASVPSSWHWFPFAGIRFAAPGNWSSGTTKYYPRACGLAVAGYSIPEFVGLDTDTHAAPPMNCMPPTEFQPVSEPTNGIRVDAIASRAVPIPTGLSTECFDLHVLTACPYSNPAYNVLYVRVTGPNLAHPVMFELGLASDGSVAREILGSLRAA